MKTNDVDGERGRLLRAAAFLGLLVLSATWLAVESRAAFGADEGLETVAGPALDPAKSPKSSCKMPSTSFKTSLRSEGL